MYDSKRQFHSSRDYESYLKTLSQLPQGFAVKTGSLSFSLFPDKIEQARTSSHHMNCSLLFLDRPTKVFTALTTQNPLVSCCITHLREQLSRPFLRAVCVNNVIANALCTHGEENVQRICKATGKLLSSPPDHCVSLSTGIIGPNLPIEKMEICIADLSKKKPEGALSFARAIMTTDRYPKILRHNFPRGGSVSVIAKGAGMVEPHLATMLVFILSDCAFPLSVFREFIQKTTETNFACLSIDGDASTNDVVLGMSSASVLPPSETEYFDALNNLCRQMADLIVRNGEGTEHVMSFTLRGLSSRREGRALARVISRSALLKTAINGNDPNVGRIAMALGNALMQTKSDVDFTTIDVSLGGVLIFSRGVVCYSYNNERKLSRYLKSAAFGGNENYPSHHRSVELTFDFHDGNQEITFLSSDFSKEYVRINADYRS